MSSWKTIQPEALTDNPFHLIGKDWMLVTAKNKEQVNTMTASWGGVGVMWGKSVAFLVIRPQRFTKKLIDTSDTLSLSFFTEEYRDVLKYCGSVSGRDEDKIGHTKLTVEEINGTPVFKEARMNLVCKKLYAQPMSRDFLLDSTIPDAWYKDGDYHTLYIAEITNVLLRDEE